MVGLGYAKDTLALEHGAISNYYTAINSRRNDWETREETPNKLAAAVVFRKAGIQGHMSGYGNNIISAKDIIQRQKIDFYCL